MIKFILKIHHRNYGAITKSFLTHDACYAAYQDAIQAPEWHDCVTMLFKPDAFADSGSGFVLNQWRPRRDG